MGLAGRGIGFARDLGRKPRPFANDPILKVLSLNLFCLSEVMSRPDDEQGRILS